MSTVGLDDKYLATRGRVYLTGVQALVRLPIHQRDAISPRASTRRASSPAIAARRSAPTTWRSGRRAPQLEAHRVRFEPGVNEDLAATAVWGSQQADLLGAALRRRLRIWYGKGPGVDRSCDALKHGNYAGTAPNGGVLALAATTPARSRPRSRTRASRR